MLISYIYKKTTCHNSEGQTFLSVPNRWMLFCVPKRQTGMSVLLTRFQGIVLVSLMVLAAATAAASPLPTKSDIDGKLRDNLGTGQVNEFDRELFAPAEQPGGPQSPIISAGSDVGGDGEENPLIDLARRMREVEGRIAAADSGQNTQSSQQQIIERLDAMIAAVRQCCCGGKSSQEQKQGGACERKDVEQSKKTPSDGRPGKSGKPSDSTKHVAVQKPEPGGAAEKEHIREIMKRLWGELPERDRERLLQYPVEQFLPEYEQMIEEYYKRLSEEENSR